MNYSRNLRKGRTHDVNRWFRRMFLVALIMGLLIGFVLGRIALAFSDSGEAATETVETVTEAPTSTPEETMATSEPVEETAEPVLLGTYRITAYCSCEKCCGVWAENRPNGIVYGAYGVELTPGVSIASPLPYGTVVEIEGLGEYTVQDKTAQWVVDKYGENIIDIYFDSHEAATEFGLQYLNVYLKEEPET